MIDSDAYLHLKNKKLKKTDKTDLCFKKMILIKYKDHSIYHLYDKKSNLIFILCSIDVNKSSMLKNLTTAEIYKIEFFIFEDFIIEFIKFDKFFTFKSHKIKSFTADKSINELIFKHVILSVRNKYKSEDKMSNSFSQTEVLKIRHKRFFTKKKNIMNSAVMSVMMMK